ncbi:hypothetical protein CASFOL_002851 [Castilleja foliolosa]|uniref:GRAS family transcription factor n=1 Tax=Castilleja foliolosa TaxID=1961234 RepID=A0ABD3EJ65_9LAMI
MTLSPSNELNCPSNSEESYVSQHKLKSDGEENNSKQVNGSSPIDEFKGNDTLINFISEMLMEEEDLGNKPSMLHDCLALQATEKSFYDALTNNLDHNSDNFTRSCSVIDNSGNPSVTTTFVDALNNDLDKGFSDSMSLGHDSEPSNQITGYYSEMSVDLRSLLMQCAQAISDFDNKTLNYLMSEIRQHSSPIGDGVRRVAHYFANALEARLTGTGISLITAFASKRLSTVEILKAYKMFVIACPLMHMSNLMANRTICILASTATTLHVIDFGILYGIQWPCLIHALSLRPGGPPKLRITGIDFPQPGFRPAERVEDTCRRLAKYGERFGVPFEYNAIAQKWDTITLEDLKIEKNELVIVNSMYRLHNVPDETETGNSPRDAVLNLIKKINPDMFVHGIANGQFNSHFFTTRFKVAFFHFSTMFDIFEATIPQDDEDRLLFEQQFFGKEAMNIIACEGTERIERPETYKHWEVRTVRAGFQQLTIDKDIVKRMGKVKNDYHKSFSVDEDGKWILLGWKGRVIQGLSCWRPTHN